MLISTRLDALGDLLRSNKVGPTVYKAEHDLKTDLLDRKYDN